MAEKYSSTSMMDAASYSEKFVPAHKNKQFSALKMEAASISETLVSIYQTTEQYLCWRWRQHYPRNIAICITNCRAFFYREAGNGDSRSLGNVDITFPSTVLYCSEGGSNEFSRNVVSLTQNYRLFFYDEVGTRFLRNIGPTRLYGVTSQKTSSMFYRNLVPADLHLH
jgi:hypothetical protein